MKQWGAFCAKNRSYVADLNLKAVCAELATFLMPVVEGLNRDEQFQKKWAAAAVWK